MTIKTAKEFWSWLVHLPNDDANRFWRWPLFWLWLLIVVILGFAVIPYANLGRREPTQLRQRGNRTEEPS